MAVINTGCDRSNNNEAFTAGRVLLCSNGKFREYRKTYIIDNNTYMKADDGHKFIKKDLSGDLILVSRCNIKYNSYIFAHNHKKYIVIDNKPVPLKGQ